MKMMKTNIVLEKKSKFDPWQVFVGGAHRYLQDTFNESVQYTVEKHPDMDTEEAEEVAYDKLEPRYRAEVIDRYQSFLKVSKAMKKDPLHKKITATAKRLRDDDEFDEDEAFVGLLCFCSVLCLLCFVRVCLYVLCGHLLGKG